MSQGEAMSPRLMTEQERGRILRWAQMFVHDCAQREAPPLHTSGDATLDLCRALLFTSTAEERMREALEKAAKQFRFYEEEHTKKAAGFLDYGDRASSRASAEKADTNRRFAELCEAAIGKAAKP